MQKVNKIQAYFLTIQIYLEGTMYRLCILSMYYSRYSSNPSLWVSWLENQFAKNHFSTQLWFFEASENSLSINQRCTESDIKQNQLWNENHLLQECGFSKILKNTIIRI